MGYPYRWKDITVLSQAHHRNGVGGDPFVASTFRWKGHGRDVFVAVTFYGDGEYLDPLRTAVLSVDLLPDVTFGVNSWRGDHVGDALVKAWAARDAAPME